MKNIILKICFIFLAGMPAGFAQQPDSVRVFIDSALNTMQSQSIFSAKINWPSMRDSVHILAENAVTYKEAAPAIQYAFNALGDKHGWLVFKDEEYRNPAFKPDTSRITTNIKAILAKGPRLYNAVINDRYAYISIHFFGGQTNEQMVAFAQKIQDSLCKNISASTKGIIIDLRLNAGGNMFPMVAGISNVLGEVVFSEYPDSKGMVMENSAISKEGVTLNGKVITKLPKTCGDLSRLPVAVIIGPVTGSAGECLAAGFIGRDKTILIGETTAGFTTANNGYLLAGEDYGMVLAVGYLRDRKGNIYMENVQPDIYVTGGDDFFNRDQDKKIQEAVKWLNKQ